MSAGSYFGFPLKPSVLKCCIWVNSPASTTLLKTLRLSSRPLMYYFAVIRRVSTYTCGQKKCKDDDSSNCSSEYFAHTNVPCLAGSWLSSSLESCIFWHFAMQMKLSREHILCLLVWSAARCLCMLWVLLMENVYKTRCKGGWALAMWCDYRQGILNSGTLVSNVCLCFCHSSGPKFNSAIRGKIGLPHSIKLRFLSFLYLFIVSLIGFCLKSHWCIWRFSYSLVDISL